MFVRKPSGTATGRVSRPRLPRTRTDTYINFDMILKVT